MTTNGVLLRDKKSFVFYSKVRLKKYIAIRFFYNHAFFDAVGTRGANQHLYEGIHSDMPT